MCCFSLTGNPPANRRNESCMVCEIHGPVPRGHCVLEDPPARGPPPPPPPAVPPSTDRLALLSSGEEETPGGGDDGCSQFHPKIQRMPPGCNCQLLRVLFMRWFYWFNFFRFYLFLSLNLIAVFFILPPPASPLFDIRKHL